MESATVAAGPAAGGPCEGIDHAREGEEGLKAGALGYIPMLLIAAAYYYLPSWQTEATD